MSKEDKTAVDDVEDNAPAEVEDEYSGIAVSEADLAAMRETDDEPEAEEGTEAKEESAEEDAGEEAKSVEPESGKSAAEGVAEEPETSEEASAGEGDSEESDGGDEEFIDDGRKPLQYEVNAVEDADTKLAELDTKSSELKAKFEDGDIDTVEYMDQREAIAEARADIKLEQRAAEQTQRLNEAHAKDRWEEDQSRFFSENPEFKSSKALSGALQAHFNDVFVDDEWKDRSGIAKLRQAAKLAREDLGMADSNGGVVVPAKDAPSKGEPSKEEKAKALKGRGKQDAPPPDLGSTPAASEAEIGKDKFSHIDDLEGAAFEEAIAKLSPDEAERFLTQAH